LKENLSEKMSITQKPGEFRMSRRKRGKYPMGSVVRVNKMTFDVCFLSINERVQERRIFIMRRAE